jgi:hypothetical protein
MYTEPSAMSSRATCGETARLSATTADSRPTGARPESGAKEGTGARPACGAKEGTGARPACGAKEVTRSEFGAKGMDAGTMTWRVGADWKELSGR